MIALGLSEMINQIRIPYASQFSNSAQYIFATFFDLLKTLIAITICHYIGFLSTDNFVQWNIVHKRISAMHNLQIVKLVKFYAGNARISFFLCLVEK